MSASAEPLAIAGVTPTDVATPQTREELARLVAGAHARDEKVAFVGGGTELGLGGAPERLDLLVRTTALDRIVEYQPADLVVTVEAGVTLGKLAAELAPHRQRLALDPPHPERATLGGLVATNAFGPLRARFGTLRDAVVGISLVRPDGVVVRGGGRVVKNVAGFDLPKLAIGSLGTLAAIATVTVRLHPTPEASRRLRLRIADATGVRAYVQALLAEQLEPAALEAERDAEGSYRLDALFEGFSRGTHEQIERANALATTRGFAASEVDANDGDGSEASSSDAAIRTFGSVRVRCAFPPADVASVDARVLAPLMRAFAHARATVYPSVGSAFVCGDLAPGGEPAFAAVLDAARAELAARGGNAVVAEMPSAVRALVSPWGPPPPSFAVMRRLKARFDPQRSFNPGRFVGGL